MSDLDLKKQVEAELNWEPSVNAAEIGVGVKEGVVTLSGNIQSFSEKWAAERTAARVSGVRAVVNNLDVHLPSSSERTDEEIALAALDALKWSISVPADKILAHAPDPWPPLGVTTGRCLCCGGHLSAAPSHGGIGGTHSRPRNLSICRKCAGIRLGVPAPPHGRFRLAAG